MGFPPIVFFYFTYAFLQKKQFGNSEETELFFVILMEVP
jgi:hypothetical protein